MTETRQPTKMPAWVKPLMQFQVFLLRRNWLGPLGDEIMAITVKGRKTGKTYSTPIGYLRDGETIIALSRGSQWFKNALAAGEALLEIKGRPIKVSVEPVATQADREHIFELYKRNRARNFARLFGVPVAAPADELRQALAIRDFVKFRPIPRSTVQSLSGSLNLICVQLE